MTTGNDAIQKRWTQAVGFSGAHLRIPYRFIQGEFGFPDNAEDTIRGALKVITDELGGCIEFYDDTETRLYNDKYIQLRHLKPDGTHEGCSSSLGMVTETWGLPNEECGKFQEMRLGGGCLSKSTIQHEMYHALGFAHEQSRPDRDENIVIHWDNILEEKHHNFFVMETERWMDIGERYDIDSIMQYHGYAFSTNGEASMTRKDNGAPVAPRSDQTDRVSSIDILQLRKMYEDFCPVAPKTFECEDGDYFLEGRECDGILDCIDGTDERRALCGIKHCTEKITISSNIGLGVEGVYILMDANMDGKVAYQQSEGSYILSYNTDTQSWNIKDGETILAWGLNYDGDCPQGSDETWHIEPNQPYTGFTMMSGLF